MTNKALADGAQVLQRLREATSDICNVTPFCAEDEFRFTSTTVIAGKSVFVESHPSPLCYDRTPKHIARSGIDHYQVTFCFNDLEFSSGRRSTLVRAGDIFLVDMAEANRTATSAPGQNGVSHTLALILPRTLLAPLLASPDSAAASLLPRDTPQGKLVTEQLFAAYKRSKRFGLEEDGLSAINNLVSLVADGIGSRPDAEALIHRAKGRALFDSIRSQIDANLHAETLTASWLCRQFQISRATLYRLFEPAGGLSRYIQDQRLKRAFMKLISPVFSKMRIVDLAIDCHFSSESTFVRAFRQRFGLTPGEVKRLAALRARSGMPRGTIDPNDPLWPWRLI